MNGALYSMLPACRHKLCPLLHLLYSPCRDMHCVLEPVMLHSAVCILCADVVAVALAQDQNEDSTSALLLQTETDSAFCGGHLLD